MPLIVNEADRIWSIISVNLEKRHAFPCENCDFKIQIIGMLFPICVVSHHQSGVRVCVCVCVCARRAVYIKAEIVKTCLL